LVMGPDGPEIKNSCDGEAQQQFTGVYWVEIRQLQSWVSCEMVDNRKRYKH
jgi:hypothetical protein